MSGAKPLVQMISKPIVPPWDDSAKNIVRSQVIRAERYAHRVLTDRISKSPASGVLVDPIYPGEGAYSPGLKQNLRVMLHGLRPRGASIYHYFFAPNSLSSMAGRVQKSVARVKTVQTVCSAPADFEKLPRLLFTDRVVVLSEDTRRKMVDAGVSSSKIRLIRPCVEPIDAPGEERRRQIRREHGLAEEGPMVVFPGDYEFSSAARTVAGAVPLLAERVPRVSVVFACRIKRPPSRGIQEELERSLRADGFEERVHFLSRVSDMPAFVGAADVVVMPAESLYAKMDAPLVLLEAMSQQVPLVLAESAPLDELLGFGAGVGIPAGDSDALAWAVEKLLKNKELSREYGLAGAKAVREVFSPLAMTQAIEAVYDEVLEK